MLVGQPVASTPTAGRCGRSGCWRRASAVVGNHPCRRALSQARLAAPAGPRAASRTADVARRSGPGCATARAERWARRRSGFPHVVARRAADACGPAASAASPSDARRAQRADGDHGEPRRHLRPAPRRATCAGVRAPLRRRRAAQRAGAPPPRAGAKLERFCRHAPNAGGYRWAAAPTCSSATLFSTLSTADGTEPDHADTDVPISGRAGHRRHASTSASSRPATWRCCSTTADGTRTSPRSGCAPASTASTPSGTTTLERFFAHTPLRGRWELNDFGATPAVVTLRLRQAAEAATADRSAP